MKFQTMPNGNLQISLENADDKEMVEDLLAKHHGDDIAFMAGLLEETGWQPNGRLYQVSPEDVAALTNAPIITDDLSYDNDGTVSHVGNVWWFPGYQLLHFGRILLEEGRVNFTFAPSVVEEAACA